MMTVLGFFSGLFNIALSMVGSALTALLHFYLILLVPGSSMNMMISTKHFITGYKRDSLGTL